MNESENKEAQLFEACLDLPAGEREAFLKKQCPVDAKLRERVLHLLSMYETSDDFLETEPGEGSSEVMSELQRIAPSDEASGDRIGRYRLLEIIGEGAWGSVWLAEQVEDVERRVALKILKLGLDTKEFLARFEAERQMLAMMDHPNIARILDAGATSLGRPYFVMEWVKGVPLMEYADREQLGVRKRVELFTQVCLAVQHAHAKGIIHRDLKPSNILVAEHDDKAVVKVIDFGIAKTTQFRLADKTLYTAFNTFIGTPVYSSPEQLGSGGKEVDHRSDIYSLGALLYELLCGHTLFEMNGQGNPGLERVKKMILEKDPSTASLRLSSLTETEKADVGRLRGTSVSKVISLLKGDLDWIIAKCLEKDRTRRYNTVRALNEDLHNFLEDKPVSAAAPGLGYKTRKFVQRKHSVHAAWVLLPAVLIVMLALFLFLGKGTEDTGSSVQAVQSNVSPSAVEESIAVLPFLNMSSVADNAYFAGGVHEDILTNLSRITGFRITSRTSAMKYTNSELSLSEIGKELGVRYIVEGSVRRIDNYVRVSVQLIDAISDAHLWANNYDRELVDVFATQSAVAKEITNSLQLEILPETVSELKDLPTHSVKAYDLFMRAKSRDRSEPESEASMTAVRKLLEEAVQLDPDFVEAWGLLNETYDNIRRNMIIGGWFQREGGRNDLLFKELTEKAKHALNKAVALDPDNVETLLAIASDYVAENDPVTGPQFVRDRKKVIDRAIELYPEDAMAWYVLAWWYRIEADMEDASIAFKKALDLDPLNARIIQGAIIHFRAISDDTMSALLFDRLDKSLRTARPTDKMQNLTDGLIATADESLLEVYADELERLSGEFESVVEEECWQLDLLEMMNDLEGIIAMERVVPLNEDSSFWDFFSFIDLNWRLMGAASALGQTEKANEIADRIIEGQRFIPLGHSIPFDSLVTQAYGRLGEVEKAEALIETHFSQRDKEHDPHGILRLLAIASLDPDRAVRIALQEKTRHPNWVGTDVMALYFVLGTEIIVHPDMQAFYLKEGKWIDYLAKRVPEYAKFAKEDLARQ